MFETLIAILIFAIAVIGQAGLQTMAQANNKSADLKTMAIVLANDMSDRMRANLIGANAGNYNNPAPMDNGCKAVHFTDTHAVPSTCTPAQTAADDVWDWQQIIAQLLPGASGVVCLDSTPEDGANGSPACDGVGNVYAVKVFWNDKQAQGSQTGTAAAAAIIPARVSLPMRP